MKFRKGIVLLAAAGFVVMMSGVAQAGPNCCSGKATQTGSSSCSGKMSSQAGGCSSMKASGGACPGKSTSACSMQTADCEKWMRTYYQTHGWVGIESDCCVGMGTSPTVLRVSAGSPAEKAGFKSGDVLSSVNGIGFTKENQEAIQSLMMNGMKIGDTVHYTAMRGDQIVKLDATLAKISEQELSALIADHFAMSHTPASQTEKAGKTDKAENSR